MTNSIKLKILSACVALCLIIIAGLGYSTWTLHDKVNQLENTHASTYNPAAPLISPVPKSDKHWNGIWDDFNSMPRDFSQMDKWMGDMMNKMRSGRSMFQQPGYDMLDQSSTIEIEENEHEYRVIIEMFEGEEVELNTEISDGVLSVSGRVKNSASDKGASLFSQSQFLSEFSRTFVLDEPIDQAGMEVVNEKGKTIVVVPKVVS
ncbi:Hsp20/alpha crystallin family protein [Teredinibacter purpureus]|uniref:Hsp20/alpha crystallin family protein n=1 Tax=Teredinibacter purpureus TaxID=2731756 RepID=UPI0005F77D43|nr:Hsp20/alpha crystallin family protein [Teredinibacter purpureus]